jgi:archaellum component FlaC
MQNLQFRHIACVSDNTPHSILAIMEAMRQSWTDERLDDLNRNVDRRFDQVDRRFDKVDQRFELVDQRFDQVDQRFDQVDQRFEQVDQRFELVDQRFDRIEGAVEAFRAEMLGFRSEMNQRFDSMQRMMLQASVVLIVGLLGVLATVI